MLEIIMPMVKVAEVDYMVEEVVVILQVIVQQVDGVLMVQFV